MPAPLTRWITRPRPWVAAIEARIFELQNVAYDNDDNPPEAQEIITTLQEEGHDLQALKDLVFETFIVGDGVTFQSLEEYVEVPRR